LVQTLITPLMIVGFQLFISVGRRTSFVLGDFKVDHVAAIGFGLAAHTLMFSAFQTLNSEGHSLWILFSLPRSLSSILWEKVRLWGTLAFAYPLAFFAAAVGARSAIDFSGALGLAIALMGVPIYAVIATSLGVFGANPLAQDAQRKIKPAHAYFYMLLASLYTYAIYATVLWQRAALLIITSLLAFALWQRAKDQLPFLLDPSAAPPRTISLADGMVAALVFFVLQGVVLMIVLRRNDVPSGRDLLLAFVLAGAITAVGTRVVHRLARAKGVPTLIGQGLARSLGWGAAGGLLAAVLGIAYLLLLRSAPSLRQALEPTALEFPSRGPWLIALAVVAAPLFEEYIFRGLVFGGLRRSIGFVGAALGNAAIFAIVHPPISFAPVFCLAVIAAAAYEKTGTLLAPVLTHALYNGVIVGAAFLVP